jgi:hypothetical protein
LQPHQCHKRSQRHSQRKEVSMSNYITRTTQVVVLPEDQPIFSEMATKVTIVDDAADEFVEVGQSGHISLGKIVINTNEWPALREAIDMMIAQCRVDKAREE